MQIVKSNVLFKPEDKAHQKVLKKHLKDCFRLLDSRPKPSDKVVRDEFIRHEAEWRLYCIQYCLGARIADLFNANVSLEWERKYTLTRGK